MKSTNKKFVSKIIYLSNLKFLIKSPIIISFFVLQLVATISISLVINFHFENSLQAGMANVKTMWFIKYCSDILTNAIFIFVISYILFVKHKDNGIQNIEIRSGVKLKNIFFLRVAIAVTLLYSTYLINFCFSGIIFSISNIPISVLEKNILPVTGFIFLFIFIFHVFCDLFLVSFKIVLSAIIISLTTIAVSIGPIFPSIGWHATNEKLKPLTTMNEITSANAKLNYGLNFLEFIKSNSEYEWLLDDFSLLEYKNEEPVCQPNDPMCRYVGWGTNTEAWLSGLWLGIDDNVFEENIKVQLNKGVIDRMPKYFDFAWELNLFLQKNKLQHSDNVATSGDYMFDSGLTDRDEKYSKQKNNLGLFLKDLSKTNFTFEGASYNKLFSYLAKIANDITTYNEVDHNVDINVIGKYEMTGKVMPYAYATSYTNFAKINASRTYSHSLLPPLFWLVGQNIHYAMTLDNNELKVFQANSEKNSKTSMNLMFNPFVQFQFMASGKNYGSEYLTDVFNVNGEYFNLYNNRYIEVNLPTEVQNISATRGFAYDMRFNSDINSNPSEVSWENSELANIQIKEKAYVYVEPMYIMYFIIFGILEFATYKIFKYKLLK
jgi:hypothetical protein